MLSCTACVVSGCGGSSGSKSASASLHGPKQYLNAVKFSRCMRAHGVSQFPDPTNPGGFPSGAIEALNTSSPAFVSATNTCDRLLPNEGQPTAARFEGMLVDAVKVAKCIRAHGSYMPDPGVQDGQLTINMAHMNANDPKFTKAAAICDKKVFGYTVPG